MCIFLGMYKNMGNYKRCKYFTIFTLSKNLKERFSLVSDYKGYLRLTDEDDIAKFYQDSSTEFLAGRVIENSYVLIENEAYCY